MTENSAALRDYTYDASGNIITDTRPGEVFAFTYNARNRPASVTRNSVAYATYGYNAFEQLVSRATSAAGGPTGTVHYIHDLDGHIIAEADASTGATSREYIWMAAEPAPGPRVKPGDDPGDNAPTDLPLAVVDDVATTPVLLMVHTDHLGRPIRMTGSTKATVWAASYKPWGEPQSLSGSRALNLRFPGQYFQIETSLAYNWHRHYDTTTGRYTQPDPLRFVDGPSIYAYAGNSPLMRVDEDGRQSEPELKGFRDFLNGMGYGNPPAMCMAEDPDEQALKACKEAAKGGKRTWLNFCDASMWSDPIDHTRPARCRNYTNSSRIERQNFCANEYSK